MILYYFISHKYAYISILFMIDKQQLYTCNKTYPKYFENSAPKLFLNDGMIKVFSLPGMEQLHTHNFISQPALQLNLTTLCTCVMVNLLLLE